MTKKTDFIIKDFKNVLGSQEGLRVYTITSVYSGETEVVIERTISGRYPVQQLDEVLKIAEQFDAGGGRRVVSIEDLLDIYTKRKTIK